jgi:hypothetical protein
MSEPLAMTPPQLAQRWGVDPDKVLAFIRNGELRAMNLAISPTGRPRYRILMTEVERFEAARATKPPAQQPRRRRRATATTGKEWF